MATPFFSNIFMSHAIRLVDNSELLKAKLNEEETSKYIVCKMFVDLLSYFFIYAYGMHGMVCARECSSAPQS